MASCAWCSCYGAEDVPVGLAGKSHELVPNSVQHNVQLVQRMVQCLIYCSACHACECTASGHDSAESIAIDQKTWSETGFNTECRSGCIVYSQDRVESVRDLYPCTVSMFQLL